MQLSKQPANNQQQLRDSLIEKYCGPQYLFPAILDLICSASEVHARVRAYGVERQKTSSVPSKQEDKQALGNLEPECLSS
mgnify:CR=1